MILLSWIGGLGALRIVLRAYISGNSLIQSFPSIHYKVSGVLDIGSGVGQLFNWLKNKGAIEIVGIDPSERNIRTSKEMYPWVLSIQATLHEFASHEQEKFDTAFAVLVFEHIEDLGEAFRDIHSLLKDDGEFYLIIADKDFNLIDDKVYGAQDS